MASKRLLKKEITTAAASLFDEALLLRLFADAEGKDRIEEIMDDIIVFTDDALRRAHHTDGADNPKLVRAYYSRLRSDIDAAVEAFDARLTAVLEAL